MDGRGWIAQRPVAHTLGVAAIALLLALTWLGGRPSGVPEADAAAQARETFTAARCGACHALDDCAYCDVGPSLFGAPLDYQHAVDVIRNGAGAMPALDRLAPAAVDCAAAYVASLSSGGSFTTAAGGSPRSPAAACAAAHP